MSNRMTFRDYVQSGASKPTPEATATDPSDVNNMGLLQGGNGEHYISDEPENEQQVSTANESNNFPNNIVKYGKWALILVIGIIGIILGYKIFKKKKPSVKIK